MEYVAGVPLHRVWRQAASSSIGRLIMGVQLAKPLAAAHRHGNVHRDGLAKLAEPAAEDSSTRSDWAGTEDALTFCGTPRYASLEQLRQLIRLGPFHHTKH